MTSFPSLIKCFSSSGVVRYRLGDPLVDRYLEFVAGRARPNTLRALAFDLKTFFAVVGKDPTAVVAPAISHHRSPSQVPGPPSDDLSPKSCSPSLCPSRNMNRGMRLETIAALLGHRKTGGHKPDARHWSRTDRRDVSISVS